MKMLMSLSACAALVGTLVWSVAYAAEPGAASDQITIEKTTASGTKVTVTEGIGAPAGAAAADAAKPTTNAVQAPAKAAAAAAPAETGPHKARLAVLPAVFGKHFQPSFKLSETIEAAGQAKLKMIFTAEHESRLEAPSFTVALAEAFVSSRKFDVLERLRLSETLKEIDLGESEYADVAKVVPMGKALNAEYVALPQVEVVDLVAEVKDVPYVDRVQPTLKGKMIARFRVVDTATTKIVAACTEEVQVQRKLKANNSFLASEVDNLVVDLYKAASLRLLHRTLETIYPVRLLEVAEGKAILNRGEGAISVGDEFEVYTLGKAYVDPDTGETLGQSEGKTAVIKVSRVLPKLSEAEIVEGADKLAGDLKGYLCRESAKSIERKTKLNETPIAW